MSNENKEICSECGGRCCSRMPGICVPADFNNDMQLVKKVIENGRYCFDYWSSEYGAIYYVRPSVAGEEGQVVDASWGGACNFITPNGCELDYEQRPWECRDLTPSHEKCIKTKHKKEIIDTWLPYAKELKDIREELLAMKQMEMTK